MENIKFGKLEFSSSDILKRGEMYIIKGGDFWQCNCGHVGDPGYGSSPMLVMAGSTQEAVDASAVSCNGQGVTCQGLSN
jgi:hypothetical protein